MDRERDGEKRERAENCHRDAAGMRQSMRATASHVGGYIHERECVWFGVCLRERDKSGGAQWRWLWRRRRRSREHVTAR